MPGCQLHPGERIVAQCGTCGKPICVVCVKLFGYFCSEKCKAKAKSRAPAGSRGAEMAAYGSRLMWVGRLFMLIVVPIVSLTAGIWVIYTVTSKAGKIVWTFPPEKDRPFNGIFTYGDTVIASCDQVCVYGIDKNTGEALWGFDGGRGIAHIPPQLMGDLVLVSDYEHLYGVDAANGKKVWAHAYPDKQKPEPVIGEQYVAYLYQKMRMLTKEEKRKIVGRVMSNLVPDCSAICVIDGHDGNVLWRKELKKGFFGGGELAIGEKTIFYGTHTTEAELKEKSEGGDAPNGEEPQDGEEPKDPPGDDVITSEELTTKYTVFAYDAKTEHGKWKAVLEGGSGYGIGIQAIPKGVLVTTSSNVYALAETDGRLLWKHPIKQVGYLFWGPKVAGGLVFLPDNNLLTCLDLDTGKQLWTYQPKGDDDPSEPELVDDVVFLTAYVQEERKTGSGSGIHTYRSPGTEDLVADVTKQAAGSVTVSVGTLLALDAKTGKEKWQLRDVGSRLVYGNNRLITLRYHMLGLTTETRVTAIDPQSGKKLWESMYRGNIFEGFTDGERFYMSANSGVERFTMSSRQPPNHNEVGAFSIGR